MWVLLKPKEFTIFQTCRFYVLLILGGFWTFTLFGFLVSHWSQYLTTAPNIIVSIGMVLFLAIFPLSGAKDARKKVKTHSGNTGPIPVPVSTFIAVILSILFVYAVFPKDVSFFAGGIAGIFFALLVGAANVFGSYRIVGGILENLYFKISRKKKGDKEEALIKLAREILEGYGNNEINGRDFLQQNES